MSNKNTSMSDTHSEDIVKHESSMYPCVMCESPVTSQCNSISCDVCSGWLHIACSGTVTGDLYNVIDENGEDKQFICNNCSCLFNRSKRKQHLVNKSVIFFHCSYCKFKTYYKKNLKRHNKLHLDNKTNVVKESKNLNDEKILSCNNTSNTIHLIEFQSEIAAKRFQCAECDYNTTSKKIIEQHILTHFDVNKSDLNDSEECNYYLQHNKVSNSNYQYDVEENLECSECGYQSLNKESLEYHIKSHFKANNSFITSNNVDISNENALSSSSAMESVFISDNDEDVNYEDSLKNMLSESNGLHNLEEILDCSNCGYQTLNKERLENHIIFHCESNNVCIPNEVKTSCENSQSRIKAQENAQNLECLKCGYQTLNKESLENHIISHFEPNNCYISNEVKASCKNIHSPIIAQENDLLSEKDVKVANNNVLTNNSYTQSHIDEQTRIPDPIHDQMIEYPCAICELEVTPECKSVSCDNCQRWVHIKCSSTVTEIDYDRLVESGDNLEFVCEKCSVFYKNLSNNLSQISGGGPFECSYCGKSFKYKHKLRLHIQIHLREKLHSCSACEYKCVQKCDLKKHIMTHMGDQVKQYKCQYCEKRFARKDVFMKHTNRHTQEKQFNCNECDYICYRKDLLKSHMLTHTGKRPHECPYCNLRFYEKANLNLHVKSIHKKEKPYVCNTCGYSATLKSCLQSHILKYKNCVQSHI